MVNQKTEGPEMNAKEDSARLRLCGDAVCGESHPRCISAYGQVQ